MRRHRGLALLCALLLLAQLVGPAKAAGSVYFVAMEESVLPVREGDMPFWSNGYLYISTSLFSGTARETLGISAINNTAKRMTVLEKERRALLFDLDRGIAQDSSGAVYTPGAVVVGGTVFVPAAMVASFFGFQYSVTEVAHGYLVWLRSPDFGMSAGDFANAATYNMEERYESYLKSQQVTVQPTTPEHTDAPPAGARIHLCLEADAAAGALLDALDRAGGWATFYCTPAFMEANGDLLRRMTASGHTVGILLDASSQETPEEQARRGNDALYRAALSRTRLVYLPDGDDAGRQALAANGYRCLAPALDRSAYKLESSSNADSLLRRVTARRGDVSVWLGTTASGTGLRAFVTSAQTAGHYCRALTEVS